MIALQKKAETDGRNAMALPAVAFTGERYIPGFGGGALEAEHVQRYRAVCPLVADKVVLDAACGEGYGSEMLAGSAREVHGVDISEKTIQEAQIRHRRNNLSFQSASVAQLPFPDARFDVVVSFETIEHVDEDTQARFLREIKRTLKKDGVLAISTPEKYAFTEVTGQRNPFHVREFPREEFRAFLSRYFKHVRFFRQGWQDGQAMLSLVPDYPGPAADAVTARIYLGERAYWPCLFLMAICSDEVVPDLAPDLMVTPIDSAIFIDDGTGYKEVHKVAAPLDLAPSTHTFAVQFNLPPGGKSGRKLRWDPCDGRFCRCRIEKVETDGVYRGIKGHNAWQTVDGWDDFMTTDPAYEIDGDWSQATFIRISGGFDLPGIEPLAARFDARWSELSRECEAQRQKVLQIEASRSWRWTHIIRLVAAWLARHAAFTMPLKKTPS